MPGTWSAHVFILSIRWIVILRIIVVMSPLIPVYSWSKIVEAEVIWFSDVVVFIHCSLLSRLCSASSVTNSSAPKHIQLLCIIYHNMDIAQCLLCFLPWQTSSNTFQSLAFRTNAKSSVRTISAYLSMGSYDRYYTSWIHALITRRHPASIITFVFLLSHPSIHLQSFVTHRRICLTMHVSCIVSWRERERPKKGPLNNMRLTLLCDGWHFGNKSVNTGIKFSFRYSTPTSTSLERE